MNKDQDYPSDSDQSDEDFCPDNESDSDIPSNEESDYKGSTSESDAEQAKNTNLKKKTKRKKLKLNATNNDSIITNDGIEKNVPVSEEKEKKRSDDLWASFLSDVNGGSTSEAHCITNGSSTSKEVIRTNEIEKKENKNEIKNDKIIKKLEVTEILEFAGEEIEVPKEISIEYEKKESPINIIKQSNSLLNKFSKVPLKRPSGGLSSVLGQIGKKTKISVLEKSKLDWEGFKSKEGLKEDLKTFNKGKDGYLERQDFLQRTDLRQFEIEKDLRQTKRKF